MANNKLAAVVILMVAFLAAPAAGQAGYFNFCFGGWLNLPIFNCPSGSTRNRIPRQQGPYPSGSGLSYGYYNQPWSSSFCPVAEWIVRNAVRKAVAQNPGVGAGLIRLFFHDCFVRGCDGSVLLTTTNSRNNDTEREGLPNRNSLRGFEVIEAAKAEIESVCPGTVSCADIIAFAARDASTMLSRGRVRIRMPAGRLDGRESFANETDQLPGPFSNATVLEAKFAFKGLSTDDMVTLSGAHTIGRGKCFFVTNRLAELDPALAAKLKAQCGNNSNTFVNQDDVTPDVLDSQYYRNVIDKKVLFPSDAALNSTDTIAQVQDNAFRPGAWEWKFARAMEKMGNIGVKTWAVNQQGAEIRKVCSIVNS